MAKQLSIKEKEAKTASLAAARAKKAADDKAKVDAKVKPEAKGFDPKDFGITHTVKLPVPKHRTALNDLSEEILADTDKLIAKLKDAENFAKLKGRPHKHFFAFQQRLNSFSAVFQKMMR